MKKAGLVISLLGAGALFAAPALAQQTGQSQPHAQTSGQQGKSGTQQNAAQGQQNQNQTQQNQNQQKQAQQNQNQQKQNQAQQNPSGNQNDTTALNLNRDQIEQVQRTLDQKGFKSGHVDGVMGSETESALRSFQQQQKLQQTGQIDRQTLSALGLNNLMQSTTGQGGGSQQQPSSGQQPGK